MVFIVLRQQPPLLIDKYVLAHILQEMKRMNWRSEVPVVNITHKDDCPSECKDISTSFPRRHGIISDNAWPNAFDSSAGKIGYTGPDNGGVAGCISHERGEFTCHLAQVETECGDSNEDPLPDRTGENTELNENHYSGTTEALLSKNNNTPEELAYIQCCKGGRVAHFEHITVENTDNGMAPGGACLHPVTEQRPVDAQALDLNSTLPSQCSHFKLLETKNVLADRFTTITSQPSTEKMQCIPSIYHKEKDAVVESPHSGNEIYVNERIGKERNLSAGSDESVSKEKDDSHESAESSNSKEPCAKGKRVWSYGEEIPVGNKRMRKSIGANSSSVSHGKEDSSFINWISSVTKGLFRSDHMETCSLGLIPHPVANMPRNLFTCSRSNDRHHNLSCRSMGFGSIFKALYCPTSGKPMNTVNPDYKEEYADFKELYFDNKPAGSVKAVPILSIKKDQGIYQFREPPRIPSISLRRSPIREKMNHNMEYCNLLNVGSSSLSFHNDSGSSEGKEASKLTTFESNIFSNASLMNEGGRFPESLWITRFLQKDAAPKLCTTSCSQETVSAAKLTVDSTEFCHYSHNDKFSARDSSDSENALLSSEELRPYICRPLHEYSSSPMSSCFSKKLHIDVKTKFKFDSMLPSQTSIKFEPMTSVFAKRLDASSHSRTSQVQDEATPESATCFFCGKKGHKITASSDVIESDLNHLLLKMDSHRRAEETSCICIRCYLYDHCVVK